MTNLYFPIAAILVFSIIIQTAAAIMAIRLIGVTGRRAVWIIIAATLALMAVRRIVPLYRLLAGDIHPPDPINELIGLTLSVILAVGIFRIAPFFLEHKRAEEELRRLNRELRAISDCNQTLMKAEDEQTLLNDICRIICDEAGYRMAWVGYAEHDEARTIRPVARAGVEEGYLEQARLTWADTERGRGPGGTALRTGKTDYINDFSTEPKASPWRETALRRGYRSSIALPLRDENGNTFGILNIYCTDAGAFTPDEIRLLEELAADLAFGITVLRTRIRRRQAEQAVRINESRYRMGQEIGHIGSWEYNFRTARFWGSDEAKRMYGFDPEQADFSVDEVENCIPEREQVHQALLNLIESNKPYNLEFEIRPRNSTESKVITSIAEVQRDERGEPLSVVGVIQDITGRKKTEEALRKLNEELDQRVKERTRELEAKNAELKRMNKLFVGRELRMIELKETMKKNEMEIASLKKQSGGGGP
jgi:PAS domain S-box-containing protein